MEEPTIMEDMGSKVWAIAWAQMESEILVRLLREGWEPFTVLSSSPGDMIYLRKQVFLSEYDEKS